MTDPRAYARALAADAVAAGDHTGWFEKLYAAAEAGEAVVPWADRHANPMLVAWARQHDLSGTGRRAAVVGAGLGDDAEYLAGLGFATVAFDVAPSAVRGARARFPQSTVDFQVADLLALPDELVGAFDFVFEAYTVQTLVGEARAAAIAGCGRLLAPGGRLLVVARAREPEDPPGLMPWPLTRAEVEAFAGNGLRTVRVEDVRDTSEEPPVRRWRATFVR